MLNVGEQLNAMLSESQAEKLSKLRTALLEKPKMLDKPAGECHAQEAGKEEAQ